MSTHPHPQDDRPDASAQSLLVWLGIAMLIMTGVIIVSITELGVTGGIVLAYGATLVAVAAVLAYIMKFIGPEDH